ncbi:sulfite exporter TauE/SafE family protein [bacterium]|nr:sulfite exporter TauE/SafE family protein [bacterium]
MKDVSILIAFSAGILSFFSPCILPLLPVYISFISGLSVDELQGVDTENLQNSFRKIFIETLLFISGFSVVFISLGASAAYLGNLIFANQRLIELIGGTIILLFGLHVCGIFKVKRLQYEKKFHLVCKPATFIGSFIVGAVFALGWTPCVGPILGSILALAATKKNLTEGILLLGFYSLGLAIPFLLVSLSIGKIMGWLAKVKKGFNLITRITGILLIVIGAGIILKSAGVF